EIATDARCAEPMAVESTPEGIRVRATCRDSSALVGMVALPARLQGPEHTEKPSPDRSMAALSRARAQAESLRAALALPPEGTSADSTADSAANDDKGQANTVTEPVEGKGVAAATKVPSPAENVQGIAVKPSVAPSNGAIPAKSAQPDAPVAALAAVESAGPSTSGRGAGEGKSSSGMASTLAAAAILVALGIAATVFARRRSTRGRMIRIVETASIGPRRSLVVACIGGRTMVLGVSEAGVSLLDGQATLADPLPLPEKVAPAPLEDAALSLRNLVLGRREAPDAPADDGKREASLLGRLFHRVQPSFEAAGHESVGRSREFDELLAESMEDQELRRKLSLGEAGRVA
ncbi:MAG TPA: flagellar biosynthetic protein FliO, partial [Polyangia bacterium]